MNGIEIDVNAPPPASAQSENRGRRKMNLPNKLTISRFVLTVAFLAAMFSEIPYHETLALLLFSAASLTDYFDGMIARRDKLITNFGILMDPLADKILVCSAFIAFVGRGWMPAWMLGVCGATTLWCVTHPGEPARIKAALHWYSVTPLTVMLVLPAVAVCASQDSLPTGPQVTLPALPDVSVAQLTVA